MKKLSFSDFQNRTQDYSIDETETDITLFNKNQDIYTVVLKSDILEFSGLVGLEQDAISEFKKHYCCKDITSEIDPGDDMVDQAEGYSDFLKLTFDRFEKRVLAAVDKDLVNKKYAVKSLGDFLRDMFNTINTYTFAKQVKKFIKIDMMKGLISAESELDVDIGFTDAYDLKLNKLQSEQIDGYMINGKKWFGIKGVTKEIQAKITKTVQDGINSNKSISEIRDDVKADFAGFTDWRANMIARTETNRILNESTMLGYKESKIVKYKKWDAAIDERTSPICKRLNGMIVKLDEPFIDSETSKAYMTPPSHPSCRSRLIAVLH